MPNRSFILLFTFLFLLLTNAFSLPAADKTDLKPMADILGRTVFEADLLPSKENSEQKAKLPPAEYQAWRERTRAETLRNLVWSAVFTDYAGKRKIEPTQAEIDSQIRSMDKFRREDTVRREKEREALIAELRSPNLSVKRRKQAQEHLDTLNSLREHNARRELDLKESGRQKMQQEAEQGVAKVWVQQWKLNQALYREFGGRIIFQQAGWEPIDAYHALLDSYRKEKKFVVHDATLQEAVYRYFKHNFVYADEKKAKFYFEKPYWERTAEEMKAAGF